MSVAQVLHDAGFDPRTPSIWLAEGLLQYLDDAAVQHVLSQAAELAAPWQWGTDDPETFFAQHGWRATVTLPGEEGANFGRWPRPVTRDPDAPRLFLVAAHRI